MKKRLYILASAVALAAGMACAQNDVQRVEGGIFGGISVPMDRYHKFRNEVASAWGVEVRYNLKQLPADVGLTAGFSNSMHEYDAPNHEWFKSAQYTYRTWQIAAVGDWNFRQGALVNPFAGLGLGIGIDHTDGWLTEGVTPEKKCSHFMIMPRVGVELAHHIRITGDMRLGRKPFNAFCLTLGLTLGGRPKKGK